MRVRLTEARFRKVAGVQFIPGLQRVDDEQWKAVKSHPIGKALIDRGVLEEVKNKGKGRPSNDDLIAEIAETYDMERLRELSGHKTKKVAEAAQAQIDAINAAGGAA